MQKTLLSVAAATVLAAGLTTEVDACSRVLIRTAHGESVVRTLDWDKQLGTVARVNPPGITRVTNDVPEYKLGAEWTTKYRTVVLEEHEVFHGTAAEAINDQGLSSSVLYQSDSKPFISQHEDSGAPTVNMADVVAYIAENYASVREVLEDFHAGKFQIAWNSALPEAGKHGLHFSVQDRTGDVMLIQLNEGGAVVVHHGEEDLRVMANAPLQQYHREYVETFDLENLNTANQIPASISSKDRNLRLIWNFSNQEEWAGLSWPRTEAKLQSTFDAGALVPQEVIDPTTEETYTTWVQYVYNLDNGSFKLRNLDTYTDIRFNFSDLSGFQKQMCADLVEQSNTHQRPVWKECAS